MTIQKLNGNKGDNSVDSAVHVGNKDVHSDWIFGSSPNMTGGSNNSGVIKGNNDICASILCHSRAMTRESRNEDIMPLDSRIKYENDNIDTIPLDTRVKHEYDIERALSHENDNSAFSCHSGLRAGIQRGDNLMPKAFRFAQSGRSMVEMLGTLAIIGVLSIAGIMGYSYAVDKYHANQIMNDVNLRGIDLIAQASRGGDFSLAEWPTKTSSDLDIGLEVDEATNTTEGGIYVNGVEKDICEIIADDLLPEEVELVIDGESYVSGACGETNKMVFYYDAVAEALGDGKEPECNGPVSADGTCTPCEGGSIWTGTVCECPNGCSPISPFLSPGTNLCTICPSNVVETGCGCDMGCPENYWLFDGIDGISPNAMYCYPCPSGSTSPGGKETKCTCESGTFIGCWDGTSSCKVDTFPPSPTPSCPPGPF